MDNGEGRRQGIKHSRATVKRICSACGFKDYSLIPPVSCPRCHWQPDNAVTDQLKHVRPMNRHERRVDDARKRIASRKMTKMMQAIEHAKRKGAGDLEPLNQGDGDPHPGNLPGDPT